MKVTQILYGQVVRLGKISGRDGGTIYGLNIAKACESRYGFLQGPRVLADYDLTKGISFFHGYFDNRVVIDRFQVFNDGLVVEASANTADLDNFLDDVIQWVSHENAMHFERAANQPVVYQSNLELESDAPLWRAFADFDFIGRMIADACRSYNQIAPDYSVAALSFANGGKGVFKFEQREGHPARYFSVAPLRTEDHLHIANVLEDYLKSKTIVS